MMGSPLADGGELLRLWLRGSVSGRLVRLSVRLSTIADLALLLLALGGFRPDFRWRARSRANVASASRSSATAIICEQRRNSSSTNTSRVRLAVASSSAREAACVKLVKNRLLSGTPWMQTRNRHCGSSVSGRGSPSEGARARRPHRREQSSAPFARRSVRRPRRARPLAQPDAAVPSARSFEPYAADRIRSALALIGARPLKPIRDGLTPSEPGAHPHLVPALWNEGQTYRRARTTGLLRLRIMRHERGILRQLEKFVNCRE